MTKERQSRCSKEKPRDKPIDLMAYYGKGILAFYMADRRKEDGEQSDQEMAHGIVKRFPV